MLCAVIKGPTYQDAENQLRKASQKADLVEMRLDLFENIDPDLLRKLQDSFPIPMIFTLRSKQQGGHYIGEEAERLKQIDSLASLTPHYFDLESDISKEFIFNFKRQHPFVRVILSYHDFNETPDNFSDILLKMRALPADLYKVATMAHSTLDSLQTLIFLKDRDFPIAMMNMGEEGQISRILSPIFGGKMTYASLNDEQQTAPGQLSLDMLIDNFNYKTLNNNTKLCALIGNPIDKSFSHITHNLAMKDQGLNAAYVKMKVHTEELKSFFALMKKLLFLGLSVTMPLKEHVIPFLDHIDLKARKIGAVNTILNKEGQLIGFNTDGEGALDAIEETIPVFGKRVVILGAGGAAKAIAYIAIKRGAKVIVLNRNAEKAQKIAEEFGCEGGSLESIECIKYDILINCTPVQMPIPPQYIYEGTHVMDIKNRPRVTEFLAAALEKGCLVTYGYQMFAHQAAAQFEIWFGKEIDKNRIRTIIEREVLSRS